MKIKSAIFDMDGTLVDSLIIWEVLWRRLGKKYLNDESFCPSDTDERAVRTLAMKDSMMLIHNNYKLGKSGEELLEEANRVNTEFYSNDAQLKPGAKEFLEHLYNSGTRMVIASATAPNFINLALKNCGFEKYFQTIFSCSEVGKGKEEPDVFFAAQKYLGAEVEETWVFEDSAVAIETAAKAGFKTVGIYDKYNFGHDKIQKIANYYIADGEGLNKLIEL